ncbi:MAG: hypothetical protein Q4F72_04045 [Desulfovibrionaceae bacterium]|nr:hypothetical protein [Desulfovibrionaceae bacterium]
MNRMKRIGKSGATGSNRAKSPAFGPVLLGLTLLVFFCLPLRLSWSASMLLAGSSTLRAENSAVSQSRTGTRTEQTRSSSAARKAASSARSSADASKGRSVKSGKGDAERQRAKTAGKSSGRDRRSGSDSVHGQPWAFETGRSASVWGSSGIDGNDLLRMATGRTGAQPQKEGEDSGHRRRSAADAFRLSVDRESSDWQASAGHETKPGEDITLDSQHRVRAFATMQDEDLSVGVGPEFVVRDQQQSSHLLNPGDRPDIDAGVGMRLKLDF